MREYPAALERVREMVARAKGKLFERPEAKIARSRVMEHLRPVFDLPLTFSAYLPEGVSFPPIGDSQSDDQAQVKEVDAKKAEQL